MMKKTVIVLASRNRKKVAELQKLLNEELGEIIELKSLDDVGITDEIEENGTTFAENALIKAEAAAKSGYLGLGDDSGLVVTALDMAPGVYSARYAGVHGDDEANNRLLLENMQGKADRSAAFVCALACAFPDGTVPIRASGAVAGEILCAPRGEGGFGYDPLFWYDPFGKTFAELTPDEKNSISHRGAAVRQFARKFARRMGLIEDEE